MSRQAQVGAFAILALLLLFGVFYVITDFGTRHTGYRIGVHFQGAAGLHSGALVYFSGVTVGTVDSITLLEDNTVDVVLAIDRDVSIPSASKFLIQAPLTGDPNMIIVPPTPPSRNGVATVAVPMLERRVLPIEDQPVGQNSATIADLLTQGQTEVVRLDKMMADLEQREPKLLDTLQNALNNANDLTVSMKSTMNSLAAQLQSSLATASNNIVALTGSLNDTMQMNSHRINDIVVQFDQTSRALNTSMASLQSMATDPALKGNVLATTKNIADATKNMAGITHDLRNVTSDPQTQEQLKNTVANLDATLQRANSLLGAFGATSSVYGVDPNATPLPVPSAPPVFPQATSAPHATAGSLHLRDRLSSIASSLITIQLRLSELSPQKVCCPSSLYSADRGPQTDFNAVVLPHADTRLLVGANDIGYNTTANAVLIQQLNKSAYVGGGVLYSQLGFLGAYNNGLFGINTNVYNARRPEVDVYGNVHLWRGLELFAGERALNHAERRFTYGIQTHFP
jgi:phospholipid/cholesterol/gamma-HCH transport system substrate-binding protein